MGKNKNLDVKSIFNKYMMPFLIKNDFIKYRQTNDEFVFIHKEDQDIVISYTIGSLKNQLCVEIKGGAYKHESYGGLNLTIFIDGPDKIDSKFRYPYWYFDNENELIGLLEFHANLFEDWVFDWMLSKKFTDINAYEIVEMNAKKREKKFNSLSNHERQKYLQCNESNEWISTRFYPKKWKIDPEFIKEK